MSWQAEPGTETSGFVQNPDGQHPEVEPLSGRGATPPYVEPALDIEDIVAENARKLQLLEVTQNALPGLCLEEGAWEAAYG
jgi:hypothetical protein